ncbi:ArsR/SmtB family transcription factor [Micromonospora polyrhachis]|uniref:DNA-binding transcriptional ArsR family regulator n=1 Tax=Micromonospora polyrhachis TaxID=1282883 RepID=A0A7W7WRT2_9ACTN|nr:metalloregulator ArsR/SmtB family transcription factor [Micromonospora polyrhachis]MBB4961430.1 DNA-binding transcriptional ArsR family regulator [Micromonospora polyrhachis]
MSDAEVRQVTDSKVLAAVSHPLRRRLMDVLKVDGPSTVSMLAERTGQAVANVSHHMKVLGGCDLVTEAPELARDRRERWWRLVSPGLRWAAADFGDDPATQAVASAAASLNLDRHMSLARAWLAASEAEQQAWGESAFASDRWLRLTPAELAQVEQEITGVLNRWASRELPDDGQRREPVFLFAHGVPAQP